MLYGLQTWSMASPTWVAPLAGGPLEITPFVDIQLGWNKLSPEDYTVINTWKKTMRQGCRLVLDVKGKGLVLKITKKGFRLSCDSFL